MQSIISCLFSLLISSYLSAQFIDDLTSWGGPESDNLSSVQIDAQGHIYLTGTFRGTVDFDLKSGTTNLISNGQNDLFIQKLDSNYNLLWVKQIGGPEEEQIGRITLDDSGNLYALGSFKSTVDFDPGSGTQLLTAYGGSDIFIMKMDQNGNLIWVKQVGGTDNDAVNSLTLDHTGHIYTTGYFIGTADFDPGSGTSNLTSEGDLDAFIQKLDANGNLVWVKHMGGPGYDYGSYIANDAAGNVLTLGYFSDSVDFNPGSGVTMLRSLGGGDIFLQKLDENGNLIWVNQIGGNNNDYAGAVSIDPIGNLFINGRFTSAVDFDPGPGSVILTSQGTGDVFLQKLDPNGNHLWVKQIGAADNNLTFVQGAHILDEENNIYVYGNFSNSIDFDPGPGARVIISGGKYDGFIEKLDQNGNLIWVKQMEGPQTNGCSSIAFNPSGDLYVCGGFEDTARFDCIDDSNTLFSNGNRDLYLYKVNRCAFQPNIAVSASSNNPTLTAMNENACYQWLNCDSGFAVIPGETGPTFTASRIGSYAVEVMENGCVDTSSCVDVNTLSINELGESDAFSVYPNPTYGPVTVEFDKAPGKYNILITSILGYISYHREFRNDKTVHLEIDAPPGVYFLQINTSHSQRTVKIVKK